MYIVINAGKKKPDANLFKDVFMKAQLENEAIFAKATGETSGEANKSE